MLLLEIAMLIGGIYAIVFAKVPSLLVGAGKHPVEGLVARWIGVLLILPLPIAFLGNAILPLLFDKDGAQYAGMLELVTVLGFAILSGVLVRVAGKRVEPVNEKEKKSIKQNWLYIASRLWFAVGGVSSLPALFSVMMFDAPGSSEVLPTILLFWLVVSFPFVCFGSSLGIWLLKNKNEVLAFYVSLLPGLALVLIFAANKWLNVSCHGQFNCQFESTLQEQDHAVHTSECLPPVLDGGDGLHTTGCGVLEKGVTATGIISNTSEAHNWQFEAQSSDKITITIERHGDSCSQISILDSNGRVIESFENENKMNVCPSGMPSSMTTTSLYYFGPPNKGIYILRVRAPRAPSEYWFRIE